MENFEVKNPKPARVWVCLFYPEDGSIDDVVYKLSNEIHCCAWISPCHAPDPTVDGMERKPHYHIELIFDGKQSFERIKEICDFIGAKYPRVCTTKRGYARYLVHLDNPEKEQFDINDVIQIGDDSYFDCITSVADKILLMGEICDFCYQHEIFEYWYIVLYSHEHNIIEWLSVLTAQSNFFKAFLQSMQYSFKSNGSLKHFVFDIQKDKEKIAKIRQQERELESFKLCRMGVSPDIS